MVKKMLVLCLVFLFFAVSASAVEQIDLTVPDQAQIGTLTYNIARLVLDWEHGRIVIVLVGDNDERKQIVFGEADNARAMMRALNKANLSVMSLHRRIMEKLVNDGHIVGSISGVPD